MIQSTFQVGLAAVVAALITALELVTSKYPRTFRFIRGCWALWVYALIYGLLAGGAWLAIGPLESSGEFHVSGALSKSPWLAAIGIGLSTKALLHINLFTVSSGGQSFPIGTESIVQVFEPWLLRTLLVHEYNAVLEFVRPFEGKYPILTDAKQRAIAHKPATLPNAESQAFEVDIDRCRSVHDVLDLYLRTFGARSFQNAFPES